MKNTIKILFITTALLLCSCQETKEAEIKAGMVKITLLYANGADKSFDMDYYQNTHMPLVARLLGDSLKQYKIDQGIAGRTPEDSIPYLAIGYLYFDTLEAYQTAFGPKAAEIVGDIPNFTNIQPTVQVSKIIE